MGEIMIDNTKWINIANEIYALKSLIKELSSKERSLSISLQSISDHKDYSVGNFVYYKEVKRGSIDYKSIPQLKHIDLEQYRKDDIISWHLKMIGKE